MSKIVRASVVQASSSAYSQEETLDKLERLTIVAKADGAQVVVFPEAFVGGYPKYSTFGTVVGNRSMEGREEFLRYHSSAICIPSPAISRIEYISKEQNVFLVVGIIEKDGGTLYCTVVFIDPSEGYIGKHRKLVPTAMERIIWGRGDATHLPVFEREFKNVETATSKSLTVKTKISATICWENYMPLLRTYYYSKGVEIYCAPTVDSRPVWQHTMAHIAIEGRCFVLSACQFSQEKDYPQGHAVSDENSRDPDNIVIAGGSVIINPFGEILAGPLLGREGVLTADLDLNEVVQGKFDLDVVGHYARNDVFQLNVLGLPEIN